MRRCRPPSTSSTATIWSFTCLSVRPDLPFDVGHRRMEQPLLDVVGGRGGRPAGQHRPGAPAQDVVGELGRMAQREVGEEVGLVARLEDRLALPDQTVHCPVAPSLMTPNLAPSLPASQPDAPSHSETMALRGPPSLATVDDIPISSPAL